jgi:hypothetical protein
MWLSSSGVFLRKPYLRCSLPRVYLIKAEESAKKMSLLAGHGVRPEEVSDGGRGGVSHLVRAVWVPHPHQPVRLAGAGQGRAVIVEHSCVA